MIQIKPTNSIQEISRVVFWEPCLSPHKSYLFEAIAKLRQDIEIICCADTDIPADRRRMGWSSPTESGYQVIVNPEESVIKNLVKANASTTIHVLSGIRWVPTLIKCITEIKASKARYAIMSEPRVDEGWPGKLRRLQSWLTEGYHRKHAEAIFAIGRNGPPWFKSAGYPLNRIIPFAYFVSPPESSHFFSSAERKVRIGYLGRFVKTKGVFDLLDAFTYLGRNVTLDAAGTGPEEEILKSRCISRNIEAKFHGVLPITEIGSFFARIDVLVLPSTTKDDGWGVVISEALMSGVAVVATPMVGASIVLERSLFGRSVPSGSPAAISQAVRELEKSGEFAPAQRNTRAATATRFLSAEAGAKYFMQVIAWLEGRSEKPLDFYLPRAR